MTTTNCFNTFLEISPDCPTKTGETPPARKTGKTIAGIHYALLHHSPYKLTSDDVIFLTFAEKNNIKKTDWTNERKQFFSKGQPCLRTSPLARRYGWGFHFDSKGTVAIFAVNSREYQLLLKDKTLKHIKAMQSKRKDLR